MWASHALNLTTATRCLHAFSIVALVTPRSLQAAKMTGILAYPAKIHVICLEFASSYGSAGIAPYEC
jgi:hypothetical protein